MNRRWEFLVSPFFHFSRYPPGDTDTWFYWTPTLWQLAIPSRFYRFLLHDPPFDLWRFIPEITECGGCGNWGFPSATLKRNCKWIWKSHYRVEIKNPKKFTMTDWALKVLKYCYTLWVFSGDYYKIWWGVISVDRLQIIVIFHREVVCKNK